MQQKNPTARKINADLLSIPVLGRGDLARQLISKTRTTARINKLPRSRVISKITAWPILLDSAPKRFAPAAFFLIHAGNSEPWEFARCAVSRRLSSIGLEVGAAC